jgi:hypothetical protein
VSSGKVGEDAVPEVLVLAAAEDDVGDGLSPLPTAEARVSDAWNVLIEEKVVESDLFGPQLHQPFFSSLDALIHTLSACMLHYLLSVVLGECSCANGSVLGNMQTCLL